MSGLSLLYDRYSALVYTMAYRILGSAEEAEDVTQETFLELWRQVERYQPERGSLSNFLVTVARSRALDRVRSRGSRARFLQRWSPVLSQAGSGPSPLDSVEMDERSQLVQAALGHLSERERQVLEIAYYDGLSQSEIAERLAIPLGTVKSRSRQALKKLRHALKPVL